MKPLETPYAFLRFAARVAMRVVSGGVVGDLVCEVAPALLRDLGRWLGFDLSLAPPPAQADAASQSLAISEQLAIFQQPTGRARLAEDLRRIACATPEDLKLAIKELVKEIARDQPREVRQDLARYLARVPRRIRRKLARPDDPTGTSVPPDFRVTTLADLVRFLPRSKAAPSASRSNADKEGVAIELFVIGGVHRGKAFAFRGHDTFLVGRSKQAHFRLPKGDRYFSRAHFLIEVNPPHCCIMDMGSRNGTHVNGVRIEGTLALRDRDEIRAGRTHIKVRIKDSARLSIPKSAAPIDPVVLGVTHPYHPVVGNETSLFPIPGICPACHAEPCGRQVICATCLTRCRQAPPFLPNHRLLRRIGEGGMGVVSLALHEPDHQLVAVKTIQPHQAGSSSALERFLREARILQQLAHPNIVRFRAMGHHADLLYFVMDYVPGTDASRVVKKSGPISQERAIGWTLQLLEALDYAHAKGFVHRDIKPGNLLIERLSDGTERVRLADFGLARVYGCSALSGLTLQGETAGTFAFMAPEQITRFRESRPAVDLYSTAATLYYLLAGKPIFDLPRDVGRRIPMILNDPPIRLESQVPGVPQQLADVIHSALAKKPADRPESAHAMAEALKKAYTFPYQRLSNPHERGC